MKPFTLIAMDLTVHGSKGGELSFFFQETQMHSFPCDHVTTVSSDDLTDVVDKDPMINAKGNNALAAPSCEKGESLDKPFGQHYTKQFLTFDVSGLEDPDVPFDVFNCLAGSLGERKQSYQMLINNPVLQLLPVSLFGGKQ